MKKLIILALTLTLFCSYNNTKCTKKNNKKRRLERYEQYEYQKKQQSKKLKKQRQRQKKRTIKKAFPKVKTILLALKNIHSEEDKLELVRLAQQFAQSFPVSASSPSATEISFEPYETAEDLIQDAVCYTVNLKKTLLRLAPTILAVQSKMLLKNICVPVYDEIVQAVRPGWLKFAEQETQRLITNQIELNQRLDEALLFELNQRLDEALLGEAFLSQECSDQEEEGEVIMCKYY